MYISDKGLYLIKKYEGFSGKAYQDVVGVWTIGYGSTKVNGKGVVPGSRISETEASIELSTVANAFLKDVALHISHPVNQNQIDAIASFIYNVGPGAFKKSTMLRKLNAGDIQGAAKEFLRWNKAGGRVFNGLTKRRQEEMNLFLSDVFNDKVEPSVEIDEEVNDDNTYII